MAKRKPKSYRIASPAIYRDSKSTKHLRPEVRDALAGEAFELSGSLRAPSSAVRAELSGGARFPTNAKYWARHSATRLRSSTPLKGESRGRAKARAKTAKQFFAREAERARTRTTKRQYRVTMTGTVEQTDVAGTVTTYTGTQHGPWREVPAGGLTDERIKESYREVARFVVAVNARGRPQFDALYSRGEFAKYRAKGKSPNAVFYVDHAEIETRDVPLDAPDDV